MTATLCAATFSHSYVLWRKHCVMLHFVAVPARPGRGYIRTVAPCSSMVFPGYSGEKNGKKRQLKIPFFALPHNFACFFRLASFLLWSPIREGLGESQFRRLEKKLSTLPTLCTSMRCNLFSLIRSNGVSKNPSFLTDFKNVHMTLVKSAPKKCASTPGGSVCTFYELKSPKWKQPLNISENGFFINRP